MMNLKMKNKTLFLCLPAILNVPFGGSSVFGANPEKVNKENSPKRPNVLVLLTDDQTFSTIHAWGNNEIQTPNMDRLVNQGMSFTQTHVMGGLNGAISQPSRAMLLTGRGLMDVHRNGQISFSCILSDDILIEESFDLSRFLQRLHLNSWSAHALHTFALSEHFVSPFDTLVANLRSIATSEQYAHLAARLSAERAAIFVGMFVIVVCHMVLVPILIPRHTGCQNR